MCQFLVICVTKAQLGRVVQNAEDRPTIAILGTYHMGKQGNNVFKGTYDDVLSPERQKEISLLIDRLKTFRPTKVVIECDVADSSKVPQYYTAYLTGDYALSRNETNQIGFRLAKAMGHDKVHCVDWGVFPEDPLYNYQTYAQNDPELKEFLDRLMESAGHSFKEQNRQLNQMSVIDQLLYLNQKERVEADHRGYFEIMRIGRGDEYAGANYLSWWYGRNMKILVNIIRATTSPDDRILVIYGSGHLKLLTQLARESGFYDVVDPIEILRD